MIKGQGSIFKKDNKKKYVVTDNSSSQMQNTGASNNAICFATYFLRTRYGREKAVPMNGNYVCTHTYTRIYIYKTIYIFTKIFLKNPTKINI